MDENNNNSSPLSYDAPKSGEYGVDKPQNNAESTPAEKAPSTNAESTNNTATPVSAFSLNTENTSSDSSSNKETFGQTTPTQTTSFNSNQEVFGGSVEGNASSVNSYNTNYSSPYSSGAEEVSKGFAIASLVMGILSIVICCCGLNIIFGILGIIFYFVQQKDSEGKRPTQATIGLILSIIGLVFAIGSIIFAFASGTYQDILRNAQSV